MWKTKPKPKWLTLLTVYSLHQKNTGSQPVLLVTPSELVSLSSERLNHGAMFSDCLVLIVWRGKTLRYFTRKEQRVGRNGWNIILCRTNVFSSFWTSCSPSDLHSDHSLGTMNVKDSIGQNEGQYWFILLWTDKGLEQFEQVNPEKCWDSLLTSTTEIIKNTLQKRLRVSCRSNMTCQQVALLSNCKHGGMPSKWAWLTNSQTGL